MKQETRNPDIKKNMVDAWAKGAANAFLKELRKITEEAKKQCNKQNSK